MKNKNISTSDLFGKLFRRNFVEEKTPDMKKSKTLYELKKEADNWRSNLESMVNSSLNVQMEIVRDWFEQNHSDLFRIRVWDNEMSIVWAEHEGYYGGPGIKFNVRGFPTFQVSTNGNREVQDYILKFYQSDLMVKLVESHIQNEMNTQIVRDKMFGLYEEYRKHFQQYLNKHVWDWFKVGAKFETEDPYPFETANDLISVKWFEIKKINPVTAQILYLPIDGDEPIERRLRHEWVFTSIESYLSVNLQLLDDYVIS